MCNSIDIPVKSKGKEYLETYKGIRLFIHIQEYTNPKSIAPLHSGRPLVTDWTSNYKLAHPLYHITSQEIYLRECYSMSRNTAILKAKEEIGYLIASAKWKKEHGYAKELFKQSEWLLKDIE